MYARLVAIALVTYAVMPTAAKAQTLGPFSPAGIAARPGVQGPFSGAYPQGPYVVPPPYAYGAPSPYAPRGPYAAPRFQPRFARSLPPLRRRGRLVVVSEPPSIRLPDDDAPQEVRVRPAYLFTVVDGHATIVQGGGSFNRVR